MARPRSHGERSPDQRFPFRVDVAVPPVVGLGERLSMMLGWCRANIASGQWAYHGHSERTLGRIPIDFVRFYFMTKSDAELFRWRWLKQ